MTICSPAVVGNLWNVKETDTNNFTANLLALWFQGNSSLTRCVVKSRDICTFKYLNGGATVVYGMPVYSCIDK